LTTPRSSKPPFPDSFDAVVFEIEMSQRWALRQNFCKTVCPACSDLIESELEVCQRCALFQHSCNTICSLFFYPIIASDFRDRG
jgi:hypothetical protein